MTPDEFIARWRASELKARAASREHFIDLCQLLGEPTSAEAAPAGERYCFVRGARPAERTHGRGGPLPGFGGMRSLATRDSRAPEASGFSPGSPCSSRSFELARRSASARPQRFPLLSRVCRDRRRAPRPQGQRIGTWLGAFSVPVGRDGNPKGLETRYLLAVLPFGCSAPRARYIL